MVQPDRREYLYDLIEKWGFLLVYEKGESPFKIVSVIQEFESEEEAMDWMIKEWEFDESIK